MERAEKHSLVERMSEAFQGSPHVFLTDYRGLTANQSSDLRRRIRAAGGNYWVIKNRLAKRAGAGTAVERIASRLTGTCALAYHASDPVAIAKVLTEFVRDNPQLRLVAGVVDAREVVEAEGIKFLAALPGLPEMRSRLLALIQTPATLLVRLLQTPASQVARAIDARREKLEGSDAS